MAPLITLVLVTLLARGVGALGVEYVATWPGAVAVGLAAMFLLTASAHWTQPRRDGLIAMVPPALPRPALLVTVTGVLDSIITTASGTNWVLKTADGNTTTLAVDENVPCIDPGCSVTSCCDGPGTPEVVS